MSAKHESPPEPVLAGPERLAMPVLAAVGVVLAAAIAGTLALGTWSEEPARPESRVIVMDHSEVPGAVALVDEDRAVARLIEKMQLSLADKQRLKEALADKEVRLARLVVWDNVAVDGDAIVLNATGFSQTLPISHEQQTFYLPVVPGNSARITALKDGGGGVTLGVKTMIGPVFLPRLAIGDTVEIPVL
jgi:hypothetical protein